MANGENIEAKLSQLKHRLLANSRRTRNRNQPAALEPRKRLGTRPLTTKATYLRSDAGSFYKEPGSDWTTLAAGAATMFMMATLAFVLWA
jgi:hypothetical protein